MYTALTVCSTRACLLPHVAVRVSVKESHSTARVGLLRKPPEVDLRETQRDRDSRDKDSERQTLRVKAGRRNSVYMSFFSSRELQFNDFAHFL